jgi:type III pantothenate kinase
MIGELGVPADDVAVIATGYLAGVVLDECGCFTAYSPWLTLQGLELVFARNT